MRFYFTVAQLAEAMGLPAGTIRYHIRTARLTAQKTGGQWLIPKAAGERFAETYYPYHTLRRTSK